MYCLLHNKSLDALAPLDCLTAYLMLECAEVLAGVKPANLISLVNRNQLCGRNLYQLWQSYHEELAARLPDLTIRVLQTRERALLLLCYNNDQLERHMAHAGIRTLLRKAGYEANSSIEAQLGELSRRIESKGSFPHEIGLFIGYPAKDVAAFMGLIKLPYLPVPLEDLRQPGSEPWPCRTISLLSSKNGGHTGERQS